MLKPLSLLRLPLLAAALGAGLAGCVYDPYYYDHPAPVATGYCDDDCWYERYGYYPSYDPSRYPSYYDPYFYPRYYYPRPYYYGYYGYYDYPGHHGGHGDGDHHGDHDHDNHDDGHSWRRPGQDPSRSPNANNAPPPQPSDGSGRWRHPPQEPPPRAPNSNGSTRDNGGSDNDSRGSWRRREKN